MDIKALQKITYGVYIVSSVKDGKINGHTSNSAIQVTADPACVAVCVNKNNLTHDFIKESKVFCVSVLSKDAPLKFIGSFGFNSGRTFDKFKNIKYKIGITGSPVVLENTISYIEAEVIQITDAGTHTIFIGKIKDCGVISQGEPMTYAYYHEVKRGVTPKAAPTYVKEEEKKGDIVMDKYTCSVCGYVYDPEKGDPDGGINPGTPFEKLPDDWICPVCGATKDKFAKE